MATIVTPMARNVKAQKSLLRGGAETGSLTLDTHLNPLHDFNATLRTDLRPQCVGGLASQVGSGTSLSLGTLGVRKY